ncbi:MAG: hypothetical protein KJO54_08800 [Gammaproteobacteria bacterium]|nr:hypothetical protein [Gammaproteobacteria bacterium]NNF60339.1 hypothetical protein [Gammaproteobacteria bacterium]NNM20617.1 hypothetical protein [Gammaproteobacteria bacterium]
MTDRFEQDLSKKLKRGTTQVDQQTRNELARRRRAVLDAAEHGGGRSYWLPATGAAAALLAAVLLLQQLPGDGALPVAAADDSELDMEILLAEESFELYEELEFYQWLDAAGDAG